MGEIFRALPVYWYIGENDDQYKSFHGETIAWIKSLGLDPDRLGPRAAVLFYDGRYELHVDEVLRDDVRGGDRFDPLDVSSLLKIRRIIPVEAGSWPARPIEGVAV